MVLYAPPPQVRNAPRPNEGDAQARAPATGILTLSRPQNGGVSTFDARDYAVIDFILTDNQWAALVQLGAHAPNRFQGRLLNSFSYSSDDATSDEDHPKYLRCRSRATAIDRVAGPQRLLAAESPVLKLGRADDDASALGQISGQRAKVSEKLRPFATGAILCRAQRRV
jgi:hypothetical protein